MSKADVFGPDKYDSCVHRVKKLTGLLLIFHPGCGHCVQMRPEWEKMKQNLSPHTHVVEVDGSSLTEHPRLQTALPKFEGFPSVFLMRKGRPIQVFKGERNAEAMTHFTEEGLNRNNAMNGLKSRAKALAKRTKTKRKKMNGKTKKKRR